MATVSKSRRSKSVKPVRARRTQFAPVSRGYLREVANTLIEYGTCLLDRADELDEAGVETVQMKGGNGLHKLTHLAIIAASNARLATFRAVDNAIELGTVRKAKPKPTSYGNARILTTLFYVVEIDGNKRTVVGFHSKENDAQKSAYSPWNHGPKRVVVRAELALPFKIEKPKKLIAVAKQTETITRPQLHVATA